MFLCQVWLKLAKCMVLEMLTFKGLLLYFFPLKRDASLLMNKQEILRIICVMFVWAGFLFLTKKTHLLKFDNNKVR